MAQKKKPLKFEDKDLILPVHPSTLTIPPTPPVIHTWIGNRTSINDSAIEWAESVAGLHTLHASHSKNISAEPPHINKHPLLKPAPTKAVYGILPGLERTKACLLKVQLTGKPDPAPFAFGNAKGGRKSSKVAAVEDDDDSDEDDDGAKRKPKPAPKAASPAASSSPIMPAGPPPQAAIKDKRLRVLLTALRNLSHQALSTFMFAVSPAEPKAPAVLTLVHVEASQGNLEDAFASLRIPLNVTIKASMCRDLLEGLSFLHSGAGEKDKEPKWVVGGPHGSLSCRSCLVDVGWRVKIAGFGWGKGVLGLKTWEGEAGDEMEDRTFMAPEILRTLGQVGGVGVPGTTAGDMYSAAVLMNMIFADGELPYSTTYNDTADAVTAVVQDLEGKVRPQISKGMKEELKKLTTSCWSPQPNERPAAASALTTVYNAYPLLLTTYRFDDEKTGARLHALEPSDYLSHSTAIEHHHIHMANVQTAELESQLNAEKESRRRLEVKVAGLEEKLKEAKAISQAEKEAGRVTAERLKAEMKRAADDSAKEIAKLKVIVQGLQKDVLSMQYALIPRPLSDVIVSHALTEYPPPKLDPSGNAVPMINPYVPPSTLAVDLTFPPTVFESVTMLVTSISGFNRHIQQLSTAPKFLTDLLKAYYKALDDAIADASADRDVAGKDAGRSPFKRRVHMVERIADACILVGGAPDRNETHAEDIVEVAIKLLEWSTKFDASTILGGLNSRINLRIGIHTGPVTAAVLGTVPKFLMMGGTSLY
ncbi:Nitrogen permease regulator 2 [Irineochytrium annulatum]|nr:Nitrogen permease regulator 2 [Irineochytrium annulatum]